MIVLPLTSLKHVYGAKSTGEFYQEIIKPTVFVGATLYAGGGGQVAARVALHGIEGLIECMPNAINALDKMNRLTEAELQDRMNDPYRYPD